MALFLACIGREPGGLAWPKDLERYQNPSLNQFWLKGEKLFQQVNSKENLSQSLESSVQGACKAFQGKALLAKEGSEVRELLQWAHSLEPLNSGRYKKEKSDLRERLGLWGLRFPTQDGFQWLFPQEILEQNLKFDQVFEKICGRGLRPDECIDRWKGEGQTFEVLTFLSLPQDPFYQDIFRLSPVLAVDAVRPEEMKRRLGLTREWYLNNMEPSGKMTYLYRPTMDKKAKTHNNMIRQFMTTLAMFRLGKYLKDDVLLQAAERNLEFNLKAYMAIEENHQIAYILFRKKAKLGSAAFALMSLLESKTHPDRDKLLAYFLKFILGMQKPDGSFQTFYLPPGRNDNQNFYPGEAMLALMTLYESQPNRYPEIPKALGNAFPYYREYFQKRPNPAFVPWQTMALHRLYRVTKQKELADFIFKMNDFLIAMQNTPKAIKNPEPDTMGRFYDPKKRKYGPPHASSTAIYSEGLVDAFQLAQALNDNPRMKSYAYAIRWGNRSLFQLQYTQDNTYYIPNKPAVIGALHTTVTNGNIRVDNTQHSTMAWLNFLSSTGEGSMIMQLSQDE